MELLVLKDKFKNIGFPSISRSRYYLSLVPTGVRILSNEGWGIFWFKFKRKLKNMSSYQSWIKTNEPTWGNIEEEKRESLLFEYRPKISIITSVWNPEPVWLRVTIESVVNQTYDNWELCLADGKSDEPCVQQILREYIDRDGRIKVKFLAENKGISCNSNEALSLATGEYVALLDQDDELVPWALYEAVKLLNHDKSLDLIYSDEDKIDLHQKRYDPFFKPDWSLDMLLSTMYTSHLSIYRKKLLDTLGGFRQEYEGSHDYDLALRVIENTDKICHIPRILYHCRTTPSSAASNTKNEDHVHITDRKALEDYLLRNGIEGRVSEIDHKGFYRIQRRIIGNPLVSIIIPTKDNIKLLKQCLDSVLKYTQYPNYEILIVDNQSVSKELLHYYSEIKMQPKVRVIKYDMPFNFAALNNFAVSKAKGEHLLFLNNDTEIIFGGWLSAMLEHSQRKEVGAVGAKLLYPNGKVQHCGVVLDYAGCSRHICHGKSDYGGYYGGIISNYSAVTAACMMTKRSVFEEMSGFDENLAFDFNDIDLCLRMRKKGYLIVFTPYARLYHLESRTRGYFKTKQRLAQHMNEQQYFTTRWEATIKRGDPYYNPNLSVVWLDFAKEPTSRKNQ
jgi:glycosyltransferase involved in cell wall biosynthesis